MEIEDKILDISSNIRTYSNPSKLRITDMRVVDIDGAPKHCTLIKIMTNQGITGYGEVRDAASRTYALMLKSRLIGENPCNVDKLFKRIKQFGGHSRQGGGVSGVEIALWDLVGKAYGVPLYQLLGGKYRDKVRMYCDTDVDGKHTGTDMGHALKERIEKGFTFLKMDVGIELLYDEPGTLSAPIGAIDAMKTYSSKAISHQKGSIDFEVMRSLNYDVFTTPHAMTGIRITEKGLDYLENYVREVREVIGYEVPLAIDHIGHICIEDCIRFARRIEKFNIAWIEDIAPWQMTKHYVKIANSTTVPICTGEDIYLKENFKALIESGGITVAHPDILTCGGAMELKKIGDMCDDYGVALAIHMAESPIACLAAVHTAAALQNVLAVEYHSSDIPWWNDIVIGTKNPMIEDGFIQVPEKPGLGIDELNDEVIKEHLHNQYKDMWASTEHWNKEWANDRTWS